MLQRLEVAGSKARGLRRGGLAAAVGELVGAFGDGYRDPASGEHGPVGGPPGADKLKNTARLPGQIGTTTRATVVSGDKRLSGLPASAPLCFVVEKLTRRSHRVVSPQELREQCYAVIAT